MPIIKSAKKRVKVAKKAAIRNSKTKRSLKVAIKLFQTHATSGKATTKSHSKAQSEVAKAAKKRVIHKNKAARMQKKLAAQAKSAAKAPVAKKAPAKKAPVKKKTTTKKTK